MYIKTFIIALSAIVLVCFEVSSQAHVQGYITSNDNHKIKIVSTSFDTFPNVAIVFKANYESLKPIWGIRKDQIKVIENENECDIIELKNLTNQFNFKINILLDKSTSMLLNEDLIVDDYGYIIYYDKANYKAPIETAKESIISFIKKFDNEDIQLITFSDSVKFLNKSGFEKENLIQLVKEINARGATSLYDAIESVSNKTSEDSIIINVLLTDGKDTKSNINYEDLITKVKMSNCINYIIGLGDVDSLKLKEIAKKSNGSYYGISNATNLSDIYNRIFDQISSYYLITFRSEHVSRNDSLVGYSISYNVGDKNTSDSMIYILPSNVRNYILAQYNNRLLIVGISILIVLGVSIILVKKKRTFNT